MASCSSLAGSHFVALSAETRALTRDKDEPASSSSPVINEEDAAVDAAAAAAMSPLPIDESLPFDLRNKQREKTKARLSMFDELKDAFDKTSRAKRIKYKSTLKCNAGRDGIVVRQ